MQHNVLILGENSLELPPPFQPINRKIDSQWSMELDQFHFSVAIVRCNNYSDSRLLETLSTLKSKFRIKKFIVESEQLNDSLVFDLVNLYPGIKLTDKIDKSSLRSYLPNALHLTKQKHQETYQNSLSILNRAASVNSIEQGLNQCLAEFLDTEIVRLVFSPHAERFAEQMSNMNKAFHEVQHDYLDNNKASLFFIRKSKHDFKKQEIQLLQKIAEASFLSLQRIFRLEHLETLEQHWTTTFNAFDSAISVIDKEGVLIKVNKTFEKYFNDKIRKISDLIDLDSWPPEDLEKGFSFNQRNYIVNFHSYDQGWIGTIRDITEKEKLERQILESSKMAELGMIGSSIAHEINNPLGGMLSYIQLIRMDLEKDSKYYSDIKEMEAATLKCKSIVENLLGFARSQDGSELTEVDIVDLLNSAIDLCQIAIKYKGTKVVKNITTEKAVIKCHANNLVQSIKNILQNAIEATTDHEGEISISLKAVNNDYILTITDNGSGITKKDMTKIYNPLFSTKNSTKHPGLGLTVAFQIIQDHGGNLEIFSHPNGGTQATISFKRPDFTA